MKYRIIFYHDGVPGHDALVVRGERLLTVEEYDEFQRRRRTARLEDELDEFNASQPAELKANGFQVTDPFGKVIAMTRHAQFLDD